MAEKVKNWPRGPYREQYFKQLKMDRAGRPFMLNVPAATFIVADSGPLRLGFGGNVIIPLGKKSRFDLGIGYFNFPIEEVGYTGHRFSAFAHVPDWLSWATVRCGLYFETASLTSAEELVGDFSIGAEIGVGISLVPRSWRQHFDATLDFIASLGLGQPETVNTMAGGGLSAWWVF